MNIDELLVRALQDGPPDDAAFDPVLLDVRFPPETEVAPVASLVRGGRVFVVRPARGTIRAEPSLRVAVRGMAVALAAIVVAAGGFAVGRATTTGGAAASPAATSPLAPTPLVQEPTVPDRAEHAFTVANEHPLSPYWVVCPAEPSLPCGSIAASSLDPKLADTENNAAISQVHGWPSGASLWPDVKAVTISGDHLVVVADAHPLRTVDPRLFSVADPSGGPTSLTGVSAEPGVWFLDLGSLAPGQYVVALLLDEATSSPAFSAIGIVVTAPPSAGPSGH